MQNTDGLTPIDSELEAALGGLRIAPGAVSRGRIMFDAGRASARRRGRLWQGGVCVLALALLVSIASRPTPTAPEFRPEPVTQQQASARPVARSAVSIEPVDLERAEAFRQYIRARQAVLDRGVDALPVSPETRGAIDPPLTREDIDGLLSST